MQYQNLKLKIHTQIHTRRGGNKILIKKKKKRQKRGKGREWGMKMRRRTNRERKTWGDLWREK